MPGAVSHETTRETGPRNGAHHHKVDSFGHDELANDVLDAATTQFQFDPRIHLRWCARLPDPSLCVRADHHRRDRQEPCHNVNRGDRLRSMEEALPRSGIRDATASRTKPLIVPLPSDGVRSSCEVYWNFVVLDRFPK